MSQHTCKSVWRDDQGEVIINVKDLSIDHAPLSRIEKCASRRDTKTGEAQINNSIYEERKGIVNKKPKLERSKFSFQNAKSTQQRGCNEEEKPRWEGYGL